MLPMRHGDRPHRGFSSPSRLFGGDTDDVDLYQDDDAFVLTIEMPGFEREDLQVNWAEGRLIVSADHEDDERGRRRTYRRSFRMPRDIEPDAIDAQYRNGVLEVRLPIRGTTTQGREIEVT